MAERYVLLGLGRARADWSGRLGNWATTGAVPGEFVRCMSPAQVRARLGSGRAWSAVLLDGDVPGVDRDLIATVRSHGAAVLVVATDAREWQDLGADGVLPPSFDRPHLLDLLDQHASMIGDSVATADGDTDEDPRLPGHLVAVTGASGVGSSVAAVALAQGLASGTDDVLLADLCRVADQAMLHDSGVVVPSVQDLVDAHRVARPRGQNVVTQTFRIDERGYRLLLGLRRPRQWPTIRPRAFASTLDSLLRIFDLVVADVEPDVEGEEDTGSIDVEERHLMSRSTLLRAHVVVLVGREGIKGVHGQVRVLLDLLHLGVPAGRILPVITCAPRNPRTRADITQALHALAASTLGGAADRLASPIFLPSRRVDDALRDGVALPRPLPDTLAGAVRGLLARVHEQGPIDPLVDAPRPEPVVPGSLGLEGTQ